MKFSARIFFIAAFALMATAALSEEPLRIISPTGDFANPGGGVSDKELAWHKHNRFFENEHNFIMARLDQGYWLTYMIFTFKYGPQQKWGVYGLVVDDKGKTWFAKREVDPKDAEVSYESISWKSGGTSIGGSYPDFTFTVDEEAFQAQLWATNLFEGWNPGTFHFEEKGKAFWTVPIYMPWAKIKGTLTLDGKKIPVSGRAYSDHVHGSHRFDLFDPMFYAVRAISPFPGTPVVSMQISYNKVHPTHGNAACPSLILMDEKGFLKATQKVTIRGADFMLHEESGYRFPRSFIVEADDDNFKLRGVFKSDRAIETMDAISQIPAYLRPIILKFVSLPVFSKWDGVFEGVYTLNGEVTRFKIRSIGEANFVGGPDAIRKE